MYEEPTIHDQMAWAQAEGESRAQYGLENPKPLSEAKYKIGQKVWYISDDKEIEELTIINIKSDAWNIYYRLEEYALSLFCEDCFYPTLDDLKNDPDNQLLTN